MLLASLIVFSVLPFAIFADASTISDKASFSIKVSKSDSDDYKDAVDVKLYCTGDGTTPITTLGCTIVVDTGVIDTFDAETSKVTTSAYMSDAKQFGDSMPMTVAQINLGKKKTEFTGLESLSLCSYNSKSKELYMFICGMKPGGLKVPASETLIADLYLKVKSGKQLSKDSIRLMKASEYKNTDKCPSQAIYPAEISSTTEVSDLCANVTLDIDKALLSSSSESDTTDSGSGDTKDSINTALKQEIADVPAISESSKTSKVYKTYATALQKAKKVLQDDSSSVAQKKQALNDLKNAKKAYTNKYSPSAQPAQKQSNVWLYVAIAAAAVIAVVIIVVVIMKKKKNEKAAE